MEEIDYRAAAPPPPLIVDRLWLSGVRNTIKVVRWASGALPVGAANWCLGLVVNVILLSCYVCIFNM